MTDSPAHPHSPRTPPSPAPGTARGSTCSPAPEGSLNADIVVVGAGPVGMTLALALAGGPHKLLLLDKRPRGAWAADPRALALSHGTRQLLEGLGAWNPLAATAIRDIHVSQRGGFGRTQIAADDYGIPALGYVMRYRDLAAALDARLPQTGAAALLDECELMGESARNPAGELPASGTVSASGKETGDGICLDILRHGIRQQVQARLVVHAEGTPGDDPAVEVHDYRQHAVLAEVRPQPGHGHRAWERFTPDGPLALLPLGEDYSVVFTVPPEKACRLLALDEAGFLAALREQFGRRMTFVASGPRVAYPLALRMRKALVGHRQVWIGNSAQTLHPVSGQGFNLGLRDAWELAEVLLDAGNDPGSAIALARYARSRAPDRQGSRHFTDGIVRLFSNDLPPLRFARGLGLLALDLAPPLRHFVARRMIWGARAWP